MYVVCTDLFKCYPFCHLCFPLPNLDELHPVQGLQALRVAVWVDSVGLKVDIQCKKKTVWVGVVGSIAFSTNGSLYMVAYRADPEIRFCLWTH